MRRIASLAFVLTLIAPTFVQAQTISLSVDLAAFEASQGRGHLTLKRVDDDGDGIADWFLLGASIGICIDYADGGTCFEKPLFALARSADCVENWFDPMRIAGANASTASWSFEKDGRRDVIHVQDGTKITEMRLVRDRCH